MYGPGMPFKKQNDVLESTWSAWTVHIIFDFLTIHESDHQQLPNFSLHTYTYIVLPKNHLHSSNEENSQNKCTNLNIFGYMQLGMGRYIF